MIKKISHIILSFLLLISTSGLAISTHYCMGKVKDVSILNTSDVCCDSEDCCHDEIEFIVMDDDFSSVNTQFLSQMFPEFVFTALNHLDQNIIQETDNGKPFQNKLLCPPKELRRLLSDYQSFLL